MQLKSTACLNDRVFCNGCSSFALYLCTLELRFYTGVGLNEVAARVDSSLLQLSVPLSLYWSVCLHSQVFNNDMN